MCAAAEGHGEGQKQRAALSQHVSAPDYVTHPTIFMPVRICMLWAEPPTSSVQLEDMVKAIAFAKSDKLIALSSTCLYH